MLDLIALVMKYYFIGAVATAFIATWIFIDVAAAIYEPAIILEDITIGVFLGAIWPFTIIAYVYFKGVQICQALYSAER